MPLSQPKRRFVVLAAVGVLVVVAIAVVVVTVGKSTPLKAAQTASIKHACSKFPQTSGSYNFPIPATNPAPVDPLATVPAAGGGSFVDTVTNQPFVPRGAHYVRLATVQLASNYILCMSSDFDVGTGLDAYNPHRAAQALSQMASYGYNVVYVGLNPLEIGNKSGTGLNVNYLANLASFINIARSDNIRVLIALMPLPLHGGYIPSGAPYTTKGSPQYHDLNLYYVDANYLAAQKRYVSDLITGLTEAECKPERHLLVRADRRGGLQGQSVATERHQRAGADRRSGPAL